MFDGSFSSSTFFLSAGALVSEKLGISIGSPPGKEPLTDSSSPFSFLSSSSSFSLSSSSVVSCSPLSSAARKLLLELRQKEEERADDEEDEDEAIDAEILYIEEKERRDLLKEGEKKNLHSHILDPYNYHREVADCMRRRAALHSSSSFSFSSLGKVKDRREEVLKCEGEKKKKICRLLLLLPFPPSPLQGDRLLSLFSLSSSSSLSLSSFLSEFMFLSVPPFRENLSIPFSPLPSTCSVLSSLKKIKANHPEGEKVSGLLPREKEEAEETALSFSSTKRRRYQGGDRVCGNREAKREEEGESRRRSSSPQSIRDKGSRPPHSSSFTLLPFSSSSFHHQGGLCVSPLLYHENEEEKKKSKESTHPSSILKEGEKEEADSDEDPSRKKEGKSLPWHATSFHSLEDLGWSIDAYGRVVSLFSSSKKKPGEKRRDLLGEEEEEMKRRQERKEEDEDDEVNRLGETHPSSSSDTEEKKKKTKKLSNSQSKQMDESHRGEEEQQQQREEEEEGGETRRKEDQEKEEEESSETPETDRKKKNSNSSSSSDTPDEVDCEGLKLSLSDEIFFSFLLGGSVSTLPSSSSTLQGCLAEETHESRRNEKTSSHRLSSSSLGCCHMSLVDSLFPPLILPPYLSREEEERYS
ncbi:hypothetical protein CSUI_009904 [Cystoisospora suis]|uniref:Uncharacterized protein n=1 Tax=Cystoisospora suis TaxID=483139 RepID=A0A2C6KIF0_9APIC|nr:hypothetical protein CSUI_009904 [Cystoisospora suis]